MHHDCFCVHVVLCGESLYALLYACGNRGTVLVPGPLRGGGGGGEASLREIVEIYSLGSFIHVSRLYLYLGTTERLLFFLRVL